MSRAFMKERDDRPADEIVPPESSHPNYVTRRGLLALQERLTAASEPRDMSYLQARIESAILVDHASPPPETVQFGATVHVEGAELNREFTIVGEDEADVGRGLISYISPLAQALMDGKKGQSVIWKRPAGDLPLVIRSIRYR
ncbi:MAG: GreA/GreB family elongation factor [Candidatus Eremiobacteraeota bacterium]|nr:GreA/GreB family elongation factor [Candidatus Eremiobacteraeota bacterium]